MGQGENTPQPTLDAKEALASQLATKTNSEPYNLRDSQCASFFRSDQEFSFDHPATATSYAAGQMFCGDERAFDTTRYVANCLGRYSRAFVFNFYT